MVETSFSWTLVDGNNDWSRGKRSTMAKRQGMVVMRASGKTKREKGEKCSNAEIFSTTYTTRKTRKALDSLYYILHTSAPPSVSPVNPYSSLGGDSLWQGLPRRALSRKPSIVAPPSIAQHPLPLPSPSPTLVAPLFPLSTLLFATRFVSKLLDIWFCSAAAVVVLSCCYVVLNCYCFACSVLLVFLHHISSYCSKNYSEVFLDFAPSSVSKLNEKDNYTRKHCQLIVVRAYMLPLMHVWCLSCAESIQRLLESRWEAEKTVKICEEGGIIIKEGERARVLAILWKENSAKNYEKKQKQTSKKEVGQSVYERKKSLRGSPCQVVVELTPASYLKHSLSSVKPSDRSGALLSASLVASGVVSDRFRLGSARVPSATSCVLVGLFEMIDSWYCEPSGKRSVVVQSSLPVTSSRPN
ncbi:hypothetical protein Ahy_B03g065434 isoform E [Arachis hypogaea]|uniref:Uncharacterized protein n=1 Tax=Arachis hypogaea TaxID=3818 RepID=A0A445A1K8_ARAHY|nr:hypothetical protein Ahy_B03g065434 isoform E [Arachis hypogaea]